MRKIVIACVLAMSMGAASAATYADVDSNVKRDFSRGQALPTVVSVELAAGTNALTLAYVLVMNNQNPAAVVKSLATSVPNVKQLVDTVATLTGYDRKLLIAAAIQGGADPSEFLDATASGGDQNSSSGISVSSSAFGGTPASSFNGGGGSAASRN